MQEIIQFLRDLSQNNNREWFNAHKDRYQEMQARFNVFVEELIARVAQFDPEIGKLTPKDCTYRIYRDIRFSADKSPYKRHFGAFLCPGGKKSGFAGYYFQVSPFSEDDYGSHMLAIGDYMTEPHVLKNLREDIHYGDGDFDRIMKGLDKRFYIPENLKLKRVPRDFPADSPFAEYLKIKAFCVMTDFSEKEIVAPNLAKRLADLCYNAKPFMDYVNRAVAYIHEEG